MRSLPAAIGVTVLLWMTACLGQAQTSDCPGVAAIKGSLNTIAERSPDGRLTACLIDYKDTDNHTYTGAFLVYNGTPRLLKTYVDAGPSGPLAWSPDSRKFVVNWTSGAPGRIWSIDIFVSATGAWKTMGSDSGHALLRSFECNMNKERELFSAKWDHWITSDEAVIQVSIDPITALCRREGLLDPLKFRVKVPSGLVVSREP